jgi:hypothetical protein
MGLESSSNGLNLGKLRHDERLKTDN